MVSRKLMIKYPTGLHLRPAGVLCDTARRFQSNITFRRGNNISNAKSLLSVLGAGVRYGDEIEIICEGEDEQEALETVIAVIEDGFGA
ncbi:MAG TPA: HPr family phosphocarrier protein [Candidatus Eubacterium avistercoris]|uniref:HPr family phosphocarrier protein n=1 Tax=Candidatus Eubacterium avistercoris TaxID=2838567 RepID=A0A9D2D2I0_9FIRM|nr:HPr family phosphocarrier protein [Candidatus Eubacterium avistercoris]